MKTTPRTTGLLLGLTMLAFAVCSQAQQATVTGGTSVLNGPNGPIPHDVAVVTVTVTGFNNVIGPFKFNRLTQFTMALTNDLGGRIRLQNNTLFVKAPGAKLLFVIASRMIHYPIGIAFSQQDPLPTTADERVGLPVFSRFQSPDAHTLLIDDSFVGGKPGSSVQYKFSIIIQSGSDGKVGIIDPGVVNES
jgi:type IV secretory pathway VirB2 component (pilin)